MQQALDALESTAPVRSAYISDASHTRAYTKHHLAIEALRAAIAQGEPTVKESLIVESEPVAIRHSWDGHGWLYTDSGSGSGWRGGIDKPDAEFVYAAPQAQPDEGDDLTIAYMAGAASNKTKPAADYVPLTDKQSWEIAADHFSDEADYATVIAFARAIERAVRGAK